MRARAVDGRAAGTLREAEDQNAAARAVAVGGGQLLSVTLLDLFS